MPPKALWLKENEPETYKGAKHICDCSDWLVHRLTGEWAASINVASTKWYYDRDEGGYPESFYSAVGLDDVLDKFPQDMLDLGSVVGELRRGAAEEMGLKAGTPVAQGGVNAFVGALGLGVVEPAKMALITGSSHVMIGQAATPLHGQVLIRMKASGLCGSDLRAIYHEHRGSGAERYQVWTNHPLINCSGDEITTITLTITRRGSAGVYGGQEESGE